MLLHSNRRLRRVLAISTGDAQDLQIVRPRSLGKSNAIEHLEDDREIGQFRDLQGVGLP